MDALPDVCQYLGSEHVREKDVGILKIHLETLFLLCTRGGARREQEGEGKGWERGEGKRLVKEMGTYPVIRELHLEVEDEGVRRGCERLVDVLMGGDDEILGGASHKSAGAGRGDMVTQASKVNRGPGRMVTQVADDQEEEDDEDNEIVPIF